MPTTCRKRFSATSAVNAISFKVAHQCPQCGGPIVLDEETRFFACDFCRVKSCICQKGFPRYMFARSEQAMTHPDAPDDGDLLFLPYWRFKGISYTCTAQGVTHRFLDISALALAGTFPNLPVSLGFRTQALALKQVTPRTRGRFIRPVDITTILEQAQNRLSRKKGLVGPGFSENIGETLSLIFAPYYHKNGILVDAVLNRPTRAAAGIDIALDDLPDCRPEKQTLFVAGICPSCGWDLEGSNDSLVLICSNCSTLWKPRDRHLKKIHFSCVGPGHDTDVMVPFWKITADIPGLPLASMADLVRLANLPGTVPADLENRIPFFWAPAFKIRPRIFLRLSARLTLEQPAPGVDQLIRKNIHVPVTLPADEAVQSIRITLAHLVRPRAEYLSDLTDLKISPRRAELVFLPFEDHTHDYVHPGIQAGINKQMLALSSNL